MGRCDNERVSIPFTGGEAAPRVQCVLGRMRSTVHPDRRLLLLLVDVTVVRRRLLSGLVGIRPDTHRRQRPFERVIPHMRAADPFRGVEVVWRPALGTPLTLVAQWNAGGIASHAAAVLITGQWAPESGDVYLRPRGSGT